MAKFHKGLSCFLFFSKRAACPVRAIDENESPSGRGHGRDENSAPIERALSQWWARVGLRC